MKNEKIKQQIQLLETAIQQEKKKRILPSKNKTLIRDELTNQFYSINGNSLKRSVPSEFTSTSNKLTRKVPVRPICRYYNWGKCSKLKCKFTHDPLHRVVCSKWLSSKCDGNGCLLSHQGSEFTILTCFFDEKGCTRDGCLYMHPHLPPMTGICRTFSVDGYCPLGLKCALRHSFECPDFFNNNCFNSKCKLIHKSGQEVLDIVPRFDDQVDGEAEDYIIDAMGDVQRYDSD